MHSSKKWNYLSYGPCHMFATKNYSHTWQWRTVLLCFVVSTLAGGKINRITNSKQKVGLDIYLYFGGIWYFAELQTCLTGRLNYPFGKKKHFLQFFWQLNSTNCCHFLSYAFWTLKTEMVTFKHIAILSCQLFQYVLDWC